MNFKKTLKNLIYLSLVLQILFFGTNSLAEKLKCDNEIINYIYKNDLRNFEYLENRNDGGIFFDYHWNSKEKKIIIKRDKDNYPVIRYSLFNLKDFIPGITSIKKINNIDLSKLNDKKINNLSYISGTNTFELINGKIISIESKPYKLNDFKLSSFEILSIQKIDTTKGILEMSFDAKFTNQRNDLSKLINRSNLQTDGYHPICLDMRDLNDWPLQYVELDEFIYDADIREGIKNKEIIIKPIFQIIYDSGKIRTLRSESGVGFFRQSFDFEKFPFDKQKLLIRIKTGSGNYQNYNNEFGDGIGSVTFITPEEGAFVNLEKFLKPEINKLKAWKIKDDGINIVSNIIFDENYYDIFEQKIITKYENVLDIEIEIHRNFQHYLLKIMLPVFLILCVAWYVLWIPTEKYEVRLNTSIIALLALIAYNFVFQDDIPKLEYLTNLDWFILLSYVFCCIPVFLSIAFSKFISKNQIKVMKVNKFIKIWGGILYILTTAQIFFVN